MRGYIVPSRIKIVCLTVLGIDPHTRFCCNMFSNFGDDCNHIIVDLHCAPCVNSVTYVHMLFSSCFCQLSLSNFVVVHQVTGEGVLFVFNPITGQPLAEPDGLIRLGYKVKQSMLLHESNKESVRGILLLDNQDNLHVYPESTHSVVISVAATTFIFTVDVDTGVLVGYSLVLSTKQVSCHWFISDHSTCNIICCLNKVHDVTSKNRFQKRMGFLSYVPPTPPHLPYNKECSENLIKFSFCFHVMLGLQ